MMMMTWRENEDWKVHTLVVVCVPIPAQTTVCSIIFFIVIFFFFFFTFAVTSLVAVWRRSFSCSFSLWPLCNNLSHRFYLFSLEIFSLNLFLFWWLGTRSSKHRTCKNFLLFLFTNHTHFNQRDWNLIWFLRCVSFSLSLFLFFVCLVMLELSPSR